MAKRARKPRLELYESYKQASGWYAAAWRDFRGLTLEELAEEVDTSKGMISDLETGALKNGGTPAQRFNRDWVEKFSKALGTTGGFLIDVNPFNEQAQTSALAGYQDLDERHQAMVLEMITALKRSGTEG